VKDHAGSGSAWFDDNFSEIVGDVTELHAFLNVRATVNAVPSLKKSDNIANLAVVASKAPL
jgi:hypothetical protein